MLFERVSFWRMLFKYRSKRRLLKAKTTSTRERETLLPWCFCLQMRYSSTCVGAWPARNLPQEADGADMGALDDCEFEFGVFFLYFEECLAKGPKKALNLPAFCLY